MSTSHHSRRVFLRHAATASLLAGSGPLLAACATAGTDNGQNNAGNKTAENPFGVRPDAPLDVVVFKGGYGDDYAKFHESLYQKRYPQTQISHKGITDIAQQLQPRFNAGNPPDVVDNSGAQALPISTLAMTGQLADLSALFDANSIDQPGKRVRDTIAPVTLEAGTFDGKPLALNYALTVFGLWYDKKLFADRGWQMAKTWPDFLSLCEQIKQAGIAPLAHQGKFPFYIAQIVLDMAVKHGGHDVIKAIDSLEPNAWRHPSVKLAAEALAELKAKGYIMQGTEGLDHVQSQTRWNERQAAFIPSGSWLENEQKSVAPKDFATTVAPTPLLAGAKLPFECTEISAAETFIVPEKAKNKPGGLEFLRIMLSKEGAAKFTELTGSPTVVVGAAQGLPLTPGAESASRLLDSGGANNWTAYFGTWYTTMVKPIYSEFGELAAGRITADEFTTRCQKIADDTAKDPGTQRRKRA